MADNENLGEGKVKFKVSDETGPGMASVDGKLRSFGDRLKGSVSGLKSFQSAITGTVGILTGLLGSVFAVVGILGSLYAICKSVGQALFDMSEESKGLASRLDDPLSASIKRATENAAKLGMVLGTIGLEEDRKQIEAYDEAIAKLNKRLDGLDPTFSGPTERERAEIVSKRNVLVRKIADTDRRLRRQYQDQQDREEAAREKEKSDREIAIAAKEAVREAQANAEKEAAIAEKAAKELAENDERTERETIKEIEDAREDAHRAHMDRIEKENAARLKGVQDLIAAEERLRDMQERQTSGFAAGRGAHDLSRIVDTLERLDRKVNYSNGRRF